MTKKDPCSPIHPDTLVVRSPVDKGSGHPASDILQFR
jgi:hypothetical protein